MRGIPWAILALAAVLPISGCRKPEPKAAASPGAVPMPSQILKDFEMNDVQKTVKTMTLKSIEARVYDEQKYADVDQPILHFYKEGRRTSELSAPSGKVFTETHEVEAWGGVKVVSADSATLTTERMHYDPKTREIRSKDPVRLEKPDSITEGIGLVTDPELARVKIGKQKVRFKKGMKS